MIFVGFLATFIYGLHLNQLIVKRFEDRRWNLPSRVYSDSFSIYEGKILTFDELKSRLNHLGYRQIQSDASHQGEYSIKGSVVQIYLHEFKYPHEVFSGQRVGFTLDGGRVSNLRDTAKDNSLNIIRLEPELVASIYDANLEDRTFVSLNEMPQHLIDAVVTIEDERFYSHAGVDPIGILRAFVTNILRGRVAQGGSTLTQQMVKNFFLTHERTLKRKINEILMALIIDFRFSKDEILEVYLNEIYFGQRDSVSVTGAEEASKLYFSKSVRHITLDEAALLAAMVQAPGRYNPFTKSENAVKRRNLVLEKMLESKKITKQQFVDATKRPLPKSNAALQHTRPGYFVDFVKRQIVENFPEDKLSSEGLLIFTTLDMHMQRAAEKAVKTWLDALEKNRGYLKKNKDAGKELQGALIALQPKTGFVRAYVGGRSYAKTQFDVVSQAKRQSGSTFKPFAYLAALDPKRSSKVFTLASLISDEPVGYKTPSGLWKPSNYDGKSHGLVSIREALAKSYNIAAVNLGMEAGLDTVLGVAKDAGMVADLEPYPSMVLGAFEVTPLNLAESYTIFPNDGIRSQAIAVRRIVTSDGEVLEKKSIEISRSFDHAPIFLTNELLKEVVERGTATSVRSRGFKKIAGGKTGTTSDYRDAWFVGFTHNLLALSWVGYLDNDKTELSGASGALPIWSDFMRVATLSDPDQDFNPADSVIIVPIDSETGLLWDSTDCQGTMINEYFIEGTEPQSSC